MTTSTDKLELKMFSEKELDDLQYSDEYANFIMENAGGDRAICNGDTLLDAMEDGYLWEDFLGSLKND